MLSVRELGLREIRILFGLNNLDFIKIKCYYYIKFKNQKIMLKDLVTSANEKGNKLVPLDIITTQLNKLLEKKLIHESDHEAVLRNKIFQNNELEKFCNHMPEGFLPFMFCPNTKSFSFNDLFNQIDLGGDPDLNTFFLKNENILDMWNPERFKGKIELGHLSCGINIGTTYEPRDLCMIKKTYKGEIQHQTHHESRITFYESLLLAFYYPDIFDVWDGIQSLGSYYGEKHHTLRIYWLNQKPYRYLKVAREDSPLIFDDRFMSPRVTERILT